MKYYLAEACQNTFIVFDCLFLHLDKGFLIEVHQTLKKEKRDDALILTEGRFQEKSLYLRMLVLGHDGKLGEFCGNGARAVASYLFAHYPEISQFYLTTPFGCHILKHYKNEFYSVTLPRARFQWNAKFIANFAQFQKEYGSCHYVEMLEPHLIVKKKMNNQELFSFGREINKRKDLFPLGMNVNSCHFLDKGLLYVKTYERGIQKITRSCGTGSLSSASLYASYGSVFVLTPGGLLEITFFNSSVELKGPAFFLR